jgi:uncharacterized protein YdeI (YjbR/CyaY-like superfamily)
MKARYFRSAAEFRQWLEANHGTATEIWLGFYKKGSGRRGITSAEALDEALCFGWIDGVRHGVDAERYANRYSPRTPTSYWSEINTKRGLELIEEGRMRPAGLAAFERRDVARTKAYSFEQKTAALSPEQERAFRRNRSAWRFWEAQPSGYRRTASWWVISAKREDTRARRLSALIEHSARGERIPLLTPPSARRHS